MAALLQPAACRAPTPLLHALAGRPSRPAQQQPHPAQQRQCCQQLQRRPRRRVRAAAAAGGGGGGLAGDDDERVDIDALAARLGQEAERLRQAGGLEADDESTEDSDAAMGAADLSPASSAASRSAEPGLLAPFGYEKTGAADILAAVGDGGFIPEEFELLQELGTINIQQMVTSIDYEESPLPTSERSARTAIIAYAATFFSGMPFQDPAPVLVKEYLPGAKAVAVNELQVLKHLAGMPETSMKWQTAAAPLAPSPPIVRLLGYFTAGQTAKAAGLLEGEDPEDALWVVLKWEGLAPLALYPATQQTSGLGLGRLFGAADRSMLDRARMIRSITRGALRALAYCHTQGVVHGALGSGSLMLSTFDDKACARLIVKLDNFGFARKITVAPAGGSKRGGGGGGGGGSALEEALMAAPEPLAPDDTPLGLGQREDLRALAIVLLECLLSALALSGPSPLTSAEAVQRLLCDVFSWSMPEFRQYCEDEPDWAVVVELLSQDGGAGWELIAALVQGSASASQLAAGRFCEL